MNNDLLKTLTERTFTRADLAYRISIIREFLEFVFFTKHEAHATIDAIDQFATFGKESDRDVAFLRELPPLFFAAFAQNSFYTQLDQLTAESKQLPALTLTLPILLDRADLEAISVWTRGSINPDLMIEVDIDPSIAVGCRMVWNNTLYDFGFEYYLNKNKLALESRLAEYVHTSSAPA